MRERLLLGPVLILALLGGLWLDEWLSRTAITPQLVRWFGERDYPPGLVVFVALAGLAILAARELAAILKAKGIEASRRLYVAAAIIGILVAGVAPGAADALTAVAVVCTAAAIMLVLSLVYYSRHKTYEGISAAVGGTMLAFVYLGLLSAFLVGIRREHSAWVLLWVLAVTKSCDIGAYFTGKAVGRHKLIEWLSPGKTWEGLLGGMALAAVVGAAGSGLLPERPMHLGVVTGALAGVTFALVGQAGDLTMSLFKRDARKKDSSALLPGFGGVLDVLDSPLLVAPVAFWLLRGLS